MLYVSTKIYKPGSFMKVQRILEDIEGNIGVELYANVDNADFMDKVEENKSFLKKLNLSIHEPIDKMEHSASKNTAEYEKTQETFDKTLRLSQELGAKYLVYHINNKEVDDKKTMLEAVERNLEEIESFESPQILLENVGIDSIGNNLFTQEEFISFALGQKFSLIIDIGHIQSNGWDLEEVIKSLKDKIVMYQIYSNLEGKDIHERAFSNENSAYMMQFLRIYKQYTPQAHIVLEYNQEYEDREGILMLDLLRLQSTLKIK